MRTRSCGPPACAATRSRPPSAFLSSRDGRIIVERDLSVPGHPDVFAIGDVSVNPPPLPQLALPAAQGGQHTARQIRRRLAGRPPEALNTATSE